MMDDARVAAVADHFLLPHCGSYCLNTGQLMEIGPGEPAQVLHRDDLNWPGSNPRLTYSVHTITALTDFTSHNGATVVAPGSHLWDDPNRYPSGDELTQAVMPAGSMLLYTGQLVHGAGENRTQAERRRAIEMSFALGWLRTEENHCLAIPLETACRWPERIQMLLGFRGYEHRTPAGRLGLVDYADPVLDLKRRGLVGNDAQPGGVWPLHQPQLASRTERT
jgi:ectoine hydroxylase-related dioxygenase (phytanoyl-CoA dioxygenase family)